MRKILIAGALLLAATNAHASDKALSYCLDQVNSGGYESGMVMSKCSFHFDLPSPFAVKCLHLVKENEFDTITIKACAIYRKEIEDGKALHRYRDYDYRYELVWKD